MGHPNCQDCYFFCRNTDTCDYWLIADQLRGCPPGAGCTKKMTQKEFRKMSVASKWDKAAGREMWKAGKSDKEIAEFYGVSASAVGQIRKKYWEKETAPAASTAVEEPPLEPVSESAPPVAPVPEKDPDEDTAKIMIRALELMTENHKGMNAVATAQIVTRLWDWRTLSDLLEAKEFLDYLIEKVAK